MQKLFDHLDHHINFKHTVAAEPPKMDFHQHQDRYEIYFPLTGHIHYFIEKQVYPLQYGDLLIMNSNELHKPNFQNVQRYEVMVIHFDPMVIEPYSSPSFDLLACFRNRPLGEQNRIQLTPGQIEDILILFQRLESLSKPYAPEGSDILFVSAFIELLIFLNRVFMGQHQYEELSLIPEKLASLLVYIDANLDRDLSLDKLEHAVFMNRSYLCRLFKKHTGSTIHEHILFKRITRAKALLREGHNVTDTCQQSGFNDYSNFIRTFKKTVGIPPRQYQLQNRDRRNRVLP